MIFSQFVNRRNSTNPVIIHWTHYLFSDWPKAHVEFSKSVSVMSSSCRLHNIHGHSSSRVIMSCMTAVQISEGNHVKFARFVLLAVSEEAITWTRAGAPHAGGMVRVGICRDSAPINCTPLMTGVAGGGGAENEEHFAQVPKPGKTPWERGCIFLELFFRAVVFKLGTRNVHHKRNKTRPVVPLPWFYLKQTSSTLNNLMVRVKTI